MARRGRCLPTSPHGDDFGRGVAPVEVCTGQANAEVDVLGLRLLVRVQRGGGERREMPRPPVRQREDAQPPVPCLSGRQVGDGLGE